MTLLDADAERAETGRYLFLDIDLAVEIVSPSSVRNDYEIKREKYAKAGLPAYLIIDPLNGECTLLQSPEHGAYQEESVLLFGATVRVRRRDGSEFALDTTKFPRS